MCMCVYVCVMCENVPTYFKKWAGEVAAVLLQSSNNRLNIQPTKKTVTSMRMILQYTVKQCIINIAYTHSQQDSECVEPDERQHELCRVPAGLRRHLENCV